MILVAEEVEDEEPGAVAAEHGAGQQGEVAGAGQVEGQGQGHRSQDMIEVIGVEHQVDAQREPDQIRVQGRAQIVDQGIFEIPDVPDEGGLVESPLGYARHMGCQVGKQRPGGKDGQYA